YEDSPIVAPDGLSALVRWWRWRRAPSLGAKAPDGPCSVVEPSGDRPTHLRKLVGAGFVALYFARDAARAHEVAAQAGAATLDVPLTRYIVVSERVAAIPPTLPQHVRLLLDFEGALARAYDARHGSLYVIRPDGHLAARRRVVHQGELERLM